MIQAEPFAKTLCMFYVIVVEVDLIISSSMPVSLNLFLLLSVNKKCHLLFYYHFLFLRTLRLILSRISILLIQSVIFLVYY